MRAGHETAEDDIGVQCSGLFAQCDGELIELCGSHAAEVRLRVMAGCKPETGGDDGVVRVEELFVGVEQAAAKAIEHGIALSLFTGKKGGGAALAGVLPDGVAGQDVEIKVARWRLIDKM